MLSTVHNELVFHFISEIYHAILLENMTFSPVKTITATTQKLAMYLPSCSFH